MDLRDIKVLVTGANGFIGKHLVSKLLKEKAQVSALIKAGSLDNVEVYKGNITDYGYVKSTVDKVNPEIIYHLAANLNKSSDETLEIINVNLNGTLNLLKALKDKNYSSFVFTSTAEVYGKNEVPFKENMELNPISPYSLSKLLAECACRFFYENYKSPITILRGFIAYGPGQAGNMFIPSMISSLHNEEKFDMTKGEQTRDFVYVDDFTEAIIKASLTKAAAGEIINICSGEEHTINEVSKIILDAIGKGKITYNQHYRDNEQWRYFGDNSKAKSLLGWYPKTSLREGLKNVLSSYTAKNI